MAKLAAVSCLSLGRSLSRVECGLAYAARAVMAGKAQDLQMGITTVQESLRNLNRMVSGGNFSTKIMAKANMIEKTLKKKRKIPAWESKAILATIQEMKTGVDQLFAKGAIACSGKKAKRG